MTCPEPEPVETSDQTSASLSEQPHLKSLLAALRLRQQTEDIVTARCLTDVARQFGLPVSQVHGVATFYSMLTAPPNQQTIRICDGIVCWMHGADERAEAIRMSTGDSNRLTIERCSCLGLCEQAPAALDGSKQVGNLDYTNLLNSTTSTVDHTPRPGRPHDAEIRIVLGRVGRIDPDSIDDAIAGGAYEGLRRARSMTPADVIGEIESAHLTGRGGAGFPTARKWRLAASLRGPRHVVCNADESEPLMFKDRVLMESDPHGVIEGMAIAAYATGAEQGVIYIRGEYEPQARRMERAIQQAQEMDLLNDEHGKRFPITVHRGAGAYICGEETALLESLEDRRGEPRLRPPYPVEVGYRGRPTVVNNVETLATAAAVLRMGGSAYLSLGNPDCPGTRLCTILGHVNTPGLVEIPHGLTLRQIIEHFGGGIRPHSEFHFALTGGAAGTFVPASRLDMPLDHRAAECGISIGAGGVLVCDQSVSVPEALCQLLHFFARESCGKCTPCRIGTSECRTILDRLLCGAGTSDNLLRLHAHARLLEQASFCGLGTSAADPIISALTHFPEEFAERLS